MSENTQSKLFQANNQTKQAVWPAGQDLDPHIFERLPELRSLELSNGMRVVLLPGMQSRSFRVGVFVNGGALHQKIDKRGVPHFVEHMMFRSTELFKDTDVITEFEQDYNLDVNGYTSDDEQYYYVSADLDDEATDAAAKLLSQIVLHPKLEAQYVELEKQIIYSEREAGESQPDQVVLDSQMQHFFSENHPLGGGGVIGESKTILEYTHQDLIDFHGEYFNPTNMMLVMSGGVSLSRMQELAEKYFAVGAKTQWQKNKLIDKTRDTFKLETLVKRDFNHIDTSLGVYLSNSELPDYSLDSFALKAMWHALSTRLFLDIREKRGLAYAVHASTFEVGHGNYVYMNAEFPKDKYVEGLKHLQEYAQNFDKLQMTADEFRRAMRSMKSTRWADNVHIIAMFAAKRLFGEGSLISPEYKLKWLDQMNLEYVNDRVGALLANQAAEMVVVGPIE